MNEPEALLAALDAADDDTQRTALIAAASRAVREQLEALLVYSEMKASLAARTVACDEFKHALDAATDDAARLALIEAADPVVVADFQDSVWWETATESEAQRRYLEKIDGG